MIRLFARANCSLSHLGSRSISSTRARVFSKFLERELTLIKVNVTSQTRPEIMQIVDIFRGRIIDVSDGAMTIEMAGDEQKTEGLKKLLEKFGIKELVRTGKIALQRGTE